ncbi:MAG: CRISPR-associated endonuclease Cas1 1 [Porticoccaceae bacterium]|nr:MAG: CRISPR-associated endonuclease Cas1 1 [Porticoccaceae bacterium]
MKPPEGRTMSFPLAQLEQISVAATVSLSSTLLLALDRVGASLVVINPRNPEHGLVCGGPGHGNLARRMRQFLWHRDESARLAAAREVVGVRLLHQYRALARHRKRRHDMRRPLTRAMQQIRARWLSLPAAADLNAVRGLEGAATAAYYLAWGQLLPRPWKFQGRRRRPPTDPVNAVLSLTFTLLHGEAVRALLSVGLDPAIGALHEITYGRQSLACDLLELRRTAAEQWILQLFREGAFAPGHFAEGAERPCLLNKEGRAQFYPRYQEEARRWRTELRQLAQQWAKRVDDWDEKHDLSECVDSHGAALPDH